MTHLNPEIIRRYDVRGVADTDLRRASVVEVADRFATQLRLRGSSQVVLGRDNRLSSDRIHGDFIGALLERGCDVTDLGETTTPVVSFAATTLGIAATAMITGSHNPAPYNGVKLQLDGVPLWGEELRSVLTAPQAAGLLRAGSYRRADMNSVYVDSAAQRIAARASDMVVVVDCGNGSAATVAPAILRAAGCDVRELFCESDGNFPNHHPDPANIQNMSSLVDEVRMQQADLGFAFDGDGNRIGVVAAGGRVLTSDETLAYAAKVLLDAHGSGGVVVTESKISDAVEQVVASARGRVELSRVGYPYIFEQMMRTGALVAGEGTGHIFLNDPPFHQGDVTFLAAWLSTRPGVVRDLGLGWGYPRRWTSAEIRVPLEGSIPSRVLSQIDAELARLGCVSRLDGTKVRLGDRGWILARASNTEPVLSLRYEASSAHGFREIQLLLGRLLESVGMSASRTNTPRL